MASWAFPPIDFPTLGILIADWIEAHCVIPDGFDQGDPFVIDNWQLYNTVNHYRVRPTAKAEDANGRPATAEAFHYRESLTVRPQKTGKGPFTAAIICAEAVGPVLFYGWAEAGDVYYCSDWGCDCGWSYTYSAGEPMGRPWPTPNIQITATSEEQTDNVYTALKPMINNGPLHDLIPKTGEQIIRLPGNGLIAPVTASADSRLGQRVTFVLQDETGIWTEQNKMHKVADAQARGAAGMGGRVWQTTNAWDPTVNSVAQVTYEASLTTGNIFVDFTQPPATLSFGNKAERRKILRLVYAGSPWVNLDNIEDLCAKLMIKDPQQAERFFGNRLVHAKGSWLQEGKWAGALILDREVPDGTLICLGFDGSDSDDFTALRAETVDGYQFTPTYGPDNRPTIWNPAEWEGQIPRSEVHAAIDEIFARYNVGRLYADPPDWRSEIGEWALKYGDKVVFEWATYRTTAMFDALGRFVTDLHTGALTHDDDPIANLHVDNARKKATTGQKYTLAKPSQHQKIDAAMASVLAHEAAAEARAAGWGVIKSRRVRFMTR